ncbi:MAG: hypothetical protein LCH46_13775 [Proteobacteria bacterium]|nr:hypothetical protein [Pseudomonadota bacterium]
MRNRIALLAFAVALAPQLPAHAKSSSYDFYSSIEWLMSEQFVDGVFDSCVASKTRREGNQVFAVGRSLAGEDFMLLHGVQELLPEGASTASGKLTLSGGISQAFTDMELRDEPDQPGQKYLTVYVPEGFVDRIASAGSVTFQFKGAKTSFTLSGSRDIVSRLDACAESGLSRMMPQRMPAIAAPAGWTAGSAEDDAGRFLSIVLPAPMDAPAGGPLFMAYVENGKGLYDIRFRSSQEDLKLALDPLQAQSQSYPAQVRLGFDRAFSTLVTRQGENFDLAHVLPDGLSNLALAGPLTIQPLEQEAGRRIDIPFTAQAALGAAAMKAARALPPLTLPSISGTYYVRGRNPDGKAYYGIAEAEMEGDALRIDWQWRSGKTDTAKAGLVSDILTAAVEGLADPVFYRIGKDGVWRGYWDKGRAVEWLVPAQPGDDPLAADQSEVTSSLNPTPETASEAAPAANN